MNCSRSRHVRPGIPSRRVRRRIVALSRLLDRPPQRPAQPPPRPRRRHRGPPGKHHLHHRRITSTSAPPPHPDRCRGRPDQARARRRDPSAHNDDHCHARSRRRRRADRDPHRPQDRRRRTTCDRTRRLGSTPPSRIDPQGLPSSSSTASSTTSTTSRPMAHRAGMSWEQYQKSEFRPIFGVPGGRCGPETHGRGRSPTRRPAGHL